MKTLQDIQASLTAVIADIQTIIDTPVIPASSSDPIIEIDVKTESGVQEKFVPDTATETSA